MNKYGVVIDGRGAQGESMEGNTQRQYETLPQPRVACTGDNDSASQAKPVDETGRWQQNRSEVALFLQQWDLEMEAMQQGLHGVAMTARHDFILKRMGGLIDEQKIDAMWQTMREQQNALPVD